jgi:hypothetical protein
MPSDIQKNERRSVHRTQWAAQFAVASELCKKGYEVAFTMGNNPSVDLMVSSPRKTTFSIDVKGLYKRNFWVVSAKEFRPNLFYVFAFVPDDAPNRFSFCRRHRSTKKFAPSLIARANEPSKRESLATKLASSHASVGHTQRNLRTRGTFCRNSIEGHSSF